MKVNKLFEKCKYYHFESLFNDLGYAYFKNGPYNLNIIGVRSNEQRKVTNLYDDVLVLIYNTPTGQVFRRVFQITTKPGDYYMKKKLGNVKGTAILVPGQYRGCWKIASHRGKYRALCQRKPVKVYRDSNLDDIYDMNPDTIDNGIFGINIHRSDKNFARMTVDAYSAGCQVFRDPTEFKTFMKICEKQAEIYGNSFTYTLIDEDSL